MNWKKFEVTLRQVVNNITVTLLLKYDHVKVQCLRNIMRPFSLKFRDWVCKKWRT
jgi:hypothetical protein